MRNPLLLAAAVAVVVATPLAAQGAQRWRDSAEKISIAIASLRKSMLATAPNATEVGRRGDLAVSATPDDRDDAAAALADFATLRDRWFAGVTPAPGGFHLGVSIHHGFRMTSSGGQMIEGLIEIAGLPDTGTVPRRLALHRERGFGSEFIDEFWDLLREGAPIPIANWMHETPPISMPVDERRQLAMYALVAGVGPIQRRCVVGDNAACALALDAVRATATDNGPIYRPVTRLDFFLTAMETGGPGAWNRFRDAAADGIAPAIAAATHLPFDTVVVRWRRGLLALHSTGSSTGASRTLVALAWTAIFLALAFGATRWG